MPKNILKRWLPDHHTIKNHKSLQNIVDEAFRQADKNGDGHIDLTEFSHLCVTLQLGYRSSFMQDLWDVLDGIYKFFSTIYVILFFLFSFCVKLRMRVLLSSLRPP